MLSQRDAKVPFGIPACGDDPDLVLRNPRSFSDFLEESVKSGLKALVAFEIDADLA
jgi:hypothetical protein